MYSLILCQHLEQSFIQFLYPRIVVVDQDHTFHYSISLFNYILYYQKVLCLLPNSQLWWGVRSTKYQRSIVTFFVYFLGFSVFYGRPLVREILVSLSSRATKPASGSLKAKRLHPSVIRHSPWVLSPTLQIKTLGSAWSVGENRERCMIGKIMRSKLLGSEVR